MKPTDVAIECGRPDGVHEHGAARDGGLPRLSSIASAIATDRLSPRIGVANRGIKRADLTACD